MGYVTLEQTNKETECHQHTFPTYTRRHSSDSECLWSILRILRQTAVQAFPVLPNIKTNILLTWGKILIQNLMYCLMIIRWTIRYLSSLVSPLQTRLRASSMVNICLLVGNIWLSRHKMGSETVHFLQVLMLIIYGPHKDSDGPDPHCSQWWSPATCGQGSLKISKNLNALRGPTGWLKS